MTINEVRTADAIFGAGDGEERIARDRVIAVGRLASQISPVDPMEKAFHRLAEEISGESADTNAKHLLHQYPLRPDLLAMTNLWRRPSGTFLAAAKGAPEAIGELCRLPPDAQTAVARVVDELAQQGMRVIGVAEASVDGVQPKTQREIPFEFLGLVGIADPIRASVPPAVRECRSAGIRVIMITGDYPATARAIAEQAGLETGDVVTGTEVARMDDAALAEGVKRTSVFARTQPGQKVRIVEALKRNGEIVAMTGDGVNDAPSLKAAHIGVAMGGRGTDVAREASDIVLLQDDFGSIVRTIRLGRRIFDNIRKAMGFVMATHIPIAGLALLPLFFNLPLIILPVHIAFLEMVVDPVCSIAFEAEPDERDVMSRRPRNPKSSLFSWPLIAWSLLQGTAVLVATASIFLLAFDRGMPEAEVRSLAFLTLVIGNVALILAGRSFSTSVIRAFSRPNPVLWIVLGVDAMLLGLVLSWKPVRNLFQFGPLHADDVVICIAIGAAVLVFLEFLKKPFCRTLRT